MDEIDQLHDRIRKTRIQKGLSQAGLAAITGVSQPTVANWESGSHIPRKAALERIGRALEVEPVWLLSGETGQASDAAQSYLNSPIHHLPIFNWTNNGGLLDRDNIVGYLPFPAPNGRLFAVTGAAGDADEHLILIIDPSVDPESTGQPCLCLGDGKWDIQPCEDPASHPNLIGRVIAELKIFPG